MFGGDVKCCNGELDLDINACLRTDGLSLLRAPTSHAFAAPKPGCAHREWSPEEDVTLPVVWHCMSHVREFYGLFFALTRELQYVRIATMSMKMLQYCGDVDEDGNGSCVNSHLFYYA